ncbi:hypothetical protein SNEBB_003666 [Seison nebaliae]|nr:hypothetical protein SNEBB_003666 [Seison nebaliae]
MSNLKKKNFQKIYSAANNFEKEVEDNANKRNNLNGNEVKNANGVDKLGVIRENNRLDDLYGYELYTRKKEILGWCINAKVGDVISSGDHSIHSAVTYYFVGEEMKKRFRINILMNPYFFVIIDSSSKCHEMRQIILKEYSTNICESSIVSLDDMDVKNHLIGKQRKCIKLSFQNEDDMEIVKKDLMNKIRLNRKNKSSQNYCDDDVVDLEDLICNQSNQLYQSNDHSQLNVLSANYSKNFYVDKTIDNPWRHIVDLREYDIPLQQRVSTNQSINVGQWYMINGNGGDDGEGAPKSAQLKHMKELEDRRPQLIVCAFDIETTKEPLKFPDAKFDQIMMISYMMNDVGYLITNREVVSEDLDDFHYHPTDEMKAKFILFNEKNEPNLLKRFFQEVRQFRPHIFVTYNGDNFDWRYIDERSTINGMSMKDEIGFIQFKQRTFSSYLCRSAIHLDCLCWVKRDSYLPVGSQGLKAVAKEKLKYNPEELDPELMCQMAMEQPKVLAKYSVSDALATYFLYMKYVHPFIFALCTILPLPADDVLRRGSGTLCEALLMVQAYRANVLIPNKQLSNGVSVNDENDQIQEQQQQQLTSDIIRRISGKGELLTNDTYVGASVEALESGIFRSDLPIQFNLDKTFLQQIIDDSTQIIENSLKRQFTLTRYDVENFDDILQNVQQQLELLKDNCICKTKPIILHLDVSAMYPNIILTNRLQPTATVNERWCASCSFNTIDAKCKRTMEWEWRGDKLPLQLSEYHQLMRQIRMECDSSGCPFHQMKREDRQKLEKKRIDDYCRSVYGRLHQTIHETKFTTICQRENSFYIDTVRQFRDRRYELKKLTKKWKEIFNNSPSDERQQAANRIIIYDSLQLAHKCILNSFYGYVMRRGSRWYSIDMAGIVCRTGVQIIMKTKDIVNAIGRPIELDTDGIWCMLPETFPSDLNFKLSSGKIKTVNFSGAILNDMVERLFTNHQYHHQINSTNLKYEIRSENSIVFEVDGPYRAMMLPAATEEGKSLKKRYAVFNMDGTIAELKGFELKRNGELQLVKDFQSKVFPSFLHGTTLNECYENVALIAGEYLRIIENEGNHITDEEIFHYLAERRSMSKSLGEYGEQKSTSITTAKRLIELLGNEIGKEKGLCCQFIISHSPIDANTSERAIPLAVFQTDLKTKLFFLKKWLKDGSIGMYDEDDDNNEDNDDEKEMRINVRDIIDWSYYLERFGTCLQKIIIIPAALQGIDNPLPSIKYPDWLQHRLNNHLSKMSQKKIDSFFLKTKPLNNHQNHQITTTTTTTTIMEIEENVKWKKLDLTNEKQLSTKIHRKKLMNFFKKIILDEKLNFVELIDNIENYQWKNFNEIMSNFKQFILFQQFKWYYQFVQRNLTKRGLTSSNIISQKCSLRNENIFGGKKTFTDNQSKRLMIENEWKILAIYPAPDLCEGTFRVWVINSMSDGIKSLKIRVPRIFYVNERIEREKANSAIYRRLDGVHLPNGRSTYYLYKYMLPETTFNNHRDTILRELETDTNIEGIYELNFPLLFRLLLQLGNHCHLKDCDEKNSGEHVANLEDETADYLDGFRRLADQSIEKYEKLKGPGEHLYDLHQLQTDNDLPKFDDIVLKKRMRGQIKKTYLKMEEISYNYLGIHIHRTISPELMKTDRNCRMLTTFIQTSNESDEKFSCQINVEDVTGNIQISNAQQIVKNIRDDIELVTMNSFKKIENLFKNFMDLFEENECQKKLTIIHFVDEYSYCWFIDHLYLMKSQFSKFIWRRVPFVPLVKVANNVNLNDINSLTWQKDVLTLLITDFHQHHQTTIKSLFDCASYLHLPLNWCPGFHCKRFLKGSTDLYGNPIQFDEYFRLCEKMNDEALFSIDIDFARYLHAGRFAINTNFNGINNHLNSTHNILSSSSSLTSIPKSYNSSGFYHMTTIYYDLESLYISTLLHINRVYELEKCNETNTFDIDNGTTIDNSIKINKSKNKNLMNMEKKNNENGNDLMIMELMKKERLMIREDSHETNQKCLLKLLKCLRVPMEKWVENCVKFNNSLSDKQLMNFERWLKSPFSIIHDHRVRNILLSSGRVLLKHFIKQLHSLGANIVFANNHQLILDTGKWDMRTAFAHAESLIRMTIDSYEAFQALHLYPTSFGRCTLWLNEKNFITNQIELKESIIDDQYFNIFQNEQFMELLSAKYIDLNEKENKQSIEEKLMNLTKIHIDSHWSLAKCLDIDRTQHNSHILSENFRNILSDYVHSIYTKLTKSIECSGNICDTISVENQITSTPAKTSSPKQDGDSLVCRLFQTPATIHDEKKKKKKEEKKKKRRFSSTQDEKMTNVNDVEEEEEPPNKMNKLEELRYTLTGRAKKLSIYRFMSNDFIQYSRDYVSNYISSISCKLILTCLEHKMKESTHSTHQTIPGYIPQLVVELQKIDCPSIFEESHQTFNPMASMTMEGRVCRFIKLLCHLLFLNDVTENECRSLYTALLRLTEINDYSLLSEWRSPCFSFILEQISCTYCFHCCDVDLCHAQQINHHNDDYCWRCFQCNRRLDKQLIQQILRKELQTFVKRLLDLPIKCSQCQQTKSFIAPSQCSCRGKYDRYLSPPIKKEFLTFYHILKNVATVGKLQILLMELEHMKERIPIF